MSEINNELYRDDREIESINNTEGIFRVPIGADNEGSEIVKDFAEIPHLLVCGHSGTGKTCFVQSVMTIMAIDHPSTELNFVIYDSKLTDYTEFNHLPHTITPVISDDERFTSILQWARIEILKRYRAFSAIQVKDLKGYNKKHEEKLPHLFIIIDDLFNLLSKTSANDVLDALKYILIHGRQAGVHCIILTSTPSSKDLQKEILTNLPIKICFAVVSKADSRTILGINGAEELAVPGEMIFKTQNQVVKCQAVYMTEDEIKDAITALDDGTTESDPNITEWLKDKDSKSEKEQTTLAGEYDEMLPQAVEIVLEMGSCSVSLLQRRIKLGYSRAAHIVDQMEELGVVGPYEGAKPRIVTIDRAGWRHLCGILGFPLPNETDYVSGSDNDDVVLENDEDDNKKEDEQVDCEEEIAYSDSDINETYTPSSFTEETHRYSNHPRISTRNTFWIRSAWVVGIVAVLVVIINLASGRNHTSVENHNLPKSTPQGTEQSQNVTPLLQNDKPIKEGTTETAVNTVVIPAYLVYDGSKKEEYDHFVEEYGLTSIEKKADGSIIMESETKIPRGNVDALVAVLSKKCGQPGYTHFVSVTVNEDGTVFTIVVNDVNMSENEKQAITDLFLIAGLHVVQSEENVQNIRVETVNMLGNLISGRDTNQ